MYHRTLVDAQTLAALLREEQLPRILDCRLRLDDPDAGRTLYLQGHIPGAVHADLERALAGPVTPTSGRHPLPEHTVLARRLGSLGVADDQQVIAYDDQGGAMAARLWWLLRWLGHDRVAVLDGGIQAWERQGGKLETGAVETRPATLTPRPPLAEPLSSETVAQELAGGRLRLLDVRAAERFRGDVEPLDPVAGHIPGAINRPFSTNLDADGRFLPAPDLRNLYADLADADHELACMCGSGITACHTLLALEHAGLSGARLYAGSWSEWIRDPTRPVAIADKLRSNR